MRKILQLFVAVSLLVFTLPNNVMAQERTISGTVLSNDDGTPMQGVTITNVKTGKRTQTNQAGYFSIQGETGQALSFSFVGFVTQPVPIPATGLVNVRMTSS